MIQVYHSMMKYDFIITSLTCILYNQKNLKKILIRGESQVESQIFRLVQPRSKNIPVWIHLYILIKIVHKCQFYLVHTYLIKSSFSLRQFLLNWYYNDLIDHFWLQTSVKSWDLNCSCGILIVWILIVKFVIVDMLYSILYWNI